MCEGETHARHLRCRYHGRRFALDGTMTHMPEFDGVEGFPSAADNLPVLPLERWGPLAFTGIAPACGFDAWMGPVRERCGFLPLDEFTFDPATSRDYLIRANWALYVDNYLEEFHIPFIHASLADTLDYATYRTETFDWCNLQLGTTKNRDEAFELPAGHPDEGTLVAAYYWWLFPNLMLNFYPWGLSVNLVQPLAQDRTRVSFLSYVWDEGKRVSRRGRGPAPGGDGGRGGGGGRAEGRALAPVPPRPLLPAPRGGHAPLPHPAGARDGRRVG